MQDLVLRITADDSYAATSHVISRKLTLSDPGIDDARNELLWSPDFPNLVEVEVVGRSSDGTGMSGFKELKKRFGDGVRAVSEWEMAAFKPA